MDVAQPLSSDAKVHLSCSSLKYYLTLLTAWHINNEWTVVFQLSALINISCMKFLIPYMCKIIFLILLFHTQIQ
jgi:hypothetical protein